MIRYFIGPKHLHNADSAYHDWRNEIPLGQDTGGVFAVSAILTVAWNGSGSIPIDDSTGFASSGGAFLSPNGSGEAWEYISYTGTTATTLTGPTRTGDSETNTNHSQGAIARPWIEVVDDDGAIEIEWRSENDLSFVTWTANIGGIRPPTVGARNGHYIVVQEKVSGNWETLIRGLIDQPKVKDDHRKLSEYTIRIVPIGPGYLQDEEIAGQRVGEWDMAQNGSASSSAPIVPGWREQDSGDYVEADPSFAAGNVIDGDADTVWIGERFIGGSNPVQQVSGEQNDYNISEIYITRPAGQPRGYEWIEFTTFNGTVPSVEIWVYNGTDAPTAAVYKPPQQAEAGDRIILADNRELFEAENPGHGAVAVIDAQLDRNSGTNPFDLLKREGSFIALWNKDTTANIQNIIWGTGAYPTGSVNEEKFNDGYPWQGPNITAPTERQSIRMLYRTTEPANYADWWDVSLILTPGYTLGEVYESYIKIDMPTMRLKLRDDVAIGYTDTFYIDDDSGPSTNGLPSSGTIQVGGEQIAYTGKSTDGLTGISRAQNSTTAEAHVAGDTVYIVRGGVKTDALPCSSIRLKRRSGGVYPTSVGLYGSSYIYGAGEPTVEGWGNNYNEFSTVVGPSSENYTYTPPSGTRLRTLAVRYLAMSYTPARPRQNQIEAIVDQGEYGSANWPSSNTFSSVAKGILSAAGFDDAALTINDVPPTVTDRTTAGTNALAVLVDLCENCAQQLTVGLDSLMTTNYNYTYTASSRTMATTWTRANAVDARWQQNKPRRIKQVKVEWNGGEAVYPATANEAGEVLEVGPLSLIDGTQASQIAQNNYNLQNDVFVVQAWDGDNTLKPGAFHGIQWDFDLTGSTLNRDCVITDVDHEYEDGEWETAVTLQQIV